MVHLLYRRNDNNKLIRKIVKEFSDQPVVGHRLLSLRVGVRLEVGELVDGDVDLGDGRGVVDVPHRPQERGLQTRLGDQLFESHLGDSKIGRLF